MLNFSKIQYLMQINELFQWIGVNAICAIICSFIDVFLFTHLFQVKGKEKNKIKVFILDVFIRFILLLLVEPPFFRALEIAVMIILFRIFLEKRIEKCIFGAIINAITIICTEAIFSRIFCIVFSNINTYIELMYNYRYKFAVVMSIAIIRILICLIVKYRKMNIYIPDDLSVKNRNMIIAISIIGVGLIYFSTVEMSLYINNLPFSIFILDTISLIVYFWIAMSNIIKMVQTEEKDKKIENLESYNKTLSIMYDSIRGFRHDYSNFLQALNGYAHADNIEGIKAMCKAATKECKDVNGMGILDPKVINNPAVYSIITNKYFLAEEQGITVDINIMINLKEVEICNYELCRILAILLDNAIEAAKKCEDKIINITFKKDTRCNRKLLIIENSYADKSIDVEKIFEKGYTSKTDTKSEHGLGLWNVRKILKNNTNLNLFTSKGELFSQQLEIYEH